LARAAAATSAAVLANTWSNPEDDVYGALWIRRRRPGHV